jgi:SAM-dependent methyltransferase
MNRDPKERFSSRVSDYVKHRPRYPREILGVFREKMNLAPASVVADIGSGTGISAELFLENGNPVYAVEPNEKMRLAAEQQLSRFSHFHSLDGTAEATGLPDHFCDLILCAQAFHWFDRPRAKCEFNRIARSGAYIALMWNERKRAGSPFLEGYESILNTYESDYQKVAHDNITDDELNDFLDGRMQRATFPNEQRLDLVGLFGRAFSSSYVPGEGHTDHAKVRHDLESLFARTQENGIVRMEYLTELYFATIL